MGNHDYLQHAIATGNDYVAHEEMYRRFCTLATGAIAVVAAMLILTAIFLT